MISISYFCHRITKIDLIYEITEIKKYLYNNVTA